MNASRRLVVRRPAEPGMAKLDLTGSRPADVSRVGKAVESVLTAFASQESAKAARIHPSYFNLWQSIARQLQGGKRLRPYITVLSYQAFGGRDAAAILPLAAAWELLHTGLLIHDDVIDRDYRRHGQLNVAGKYLENYSAISNKLERTHFAHSAAILAGDAMLLGAFRLAEEAPLDTAIKSRVLDVFHEAGFVVIGGELMDTEASFITDPAEPVAIAEAKTASYSVIGPLLSGALAAGADSSDLKSLRELGRILGIAYQLVDDMLGFFGDERSTGKSASSDLAEGRRTFVVTESLKLLLPADRRRAQKLLVMNQASEEQLLELRDLLAGTPVKTVLQTKLDELKQQAHKQIDELDLPKEFLTAFRKLTDVLLDRQA